MKQAQHSMQGNSMSINSTMGRSIVPFEKLREERVMEHSYARKGWRHGQGQTMLGLGLYPKKFPSSFLCKKEWLLILWYFAVDNVVLPLILTTCEVSNSFLS